MKVKLSSVLDLSKFLATQSGKELRDALDYLAQLSQQVITLLTSNLSYGDNFNCEIKRLEVKNNTFTTIKPGKNINVSEVRIRRVIDNNYFIIDYFGWNYDANQNINFIANFINSPRKFQDAVIDVPASAVGNIITVTSPNHGLNSGDILIFFNASGFTISGYLNGTTYVNVVNENIFTYLAPGGIPGGGPGFISYKYDDTLLKITPPENYTMVLDIIIYYG